MFAFIIYYLRKLGSKIEPEMFIVKNKQPPLPPPAIMEGLKPDDSADMLDEDAKQESSDPFEMPKRETTPNHLTVTLPEPSTSTASLLSNLSISLPESKVDKEPDREREKEPPSKPMSPPLPSIAISPALQPQTTGPTVHTLVTLPAINHPARGKSPDPLPEVRNPKAGYCFTLHLSLLF